MSECDRTASYATSLPGSSEMTLGPGLKIWNFQNTYCVSVWLRSRTCFCILYIRGLFFLLKLANSHTLKEGVLCIMRISNTRPVSSSDVFIDICVCYLSLGIDSHGDRTSRSSTNASSLIISTKRTKAQKHSIDEEKAKMWHRDIGEGGKLYVDWQTWKTQA